MRRLLVLCLLVLGCESTVGPGAFERDGGTTDTGTLHPFPIPRGAERMVPPPAYPRWWAELSTCAHLGGDFGLVRWWRAAGPTFPCPFGPTFECVGMWVPPHDIVLGDPVAGSIIKHEMLHDLLRGDSGHQHWGFRRCVDTEP